VRTLVAAFTLFAATSLGFAADPTRDALWAAVRNEDPKAVKAALEKGADVNAANEIGITAIWIAGGKKNVEVVDLLLKAGADPTARDAIWYMTPLGEAVGEGNLEMTKLLLKAGAKDVDAALLLAAAMKNLKVLTVVADTGKVSQDALDAALYAAKTEPKPASDVIERLVKAGAKPLPAIPEKERETWKSFAGTYESDGGGKTTVAVKDVGIVSRSRYGNLVLRHRDKDTFVSIGVPSETVTFVRSGNKVDRLVHQRFTAETSYFRAEAKPLAKPVAVAGVNDLGGKVTAPSNWPQFRGPDATGIADGQNPPISWDVKAGTNVRWKTPIPGLGHSCPVVWGNRVFVTTAVSANPDQKVRIGNYGDVESVNDTSKHAFHVICLDRDSGKILWDKVPIVAVPKIKRHQKGSQANCTPTTDGKRVVACFGPEGLYCYDFAGKLLWKRDLGTIDSSFTLDREYEWGFGSSPIIFDNLVILQADLSHDSFVAAYSLEDGSRVWSTPRDEIPSWSSPAIWRTGGREELVTNAAQYARGYDPATGKELWRLAKKSEVTIPAPVVSADRVIVCSGNRPIQPIIAVKPGAAGDISLKPGEKSNASVAWGRMRGGPYMATPILYRGYLYVLSNAGILTCHAAETGAEVYKERVGGTSYTASPVAADYRIYLTSEQGEVRVVKAGPDFHLLAVNKLDDYCLATPAISNGTLFVRSQHYLFALGKPTVK
jgi:outer membrane protein assembly factor BamB